MGRGNLFLCILLFAGFLQARIIQNDSENEIEPEEEDDPELEEKWFEQYLNHFDVLDNRTFYVRYFEEDKFFKPGGPLLLEIGGEGVISSDTIKTGQSYRLAKQLHGKIVQVEHRYYGKSSPFENLTADDLMYLSVDQALEDLAYFVYTLKTNNTDLKHSKVGVFGCSYSAALATWFRYKFPHLVDAAWASSAPLRAASDFYEYFEVATEVYANVSSECINTIKQGYEEIKDLLDTTEGEEEVKSTFQEWSCGNITDMDGSQILGNIRYALADHNIPPDHGVDSCRILQSGSSPAFKKLATLVISKSPVTCANDDEEYPNDGLAWSYQTCTEFGYSITTTSKNQPFNESNVAVEDDIESCIDNFGSGFDQDVLKRGIDRMNRVYGSVHLKVTKVLSVHGTQDPWHKLGLYKESSEEAPVILIEGTSHCADQADDDDEPRQLTRAKSKGRTIMRKWLQ